VTTLLPRAILLLLLISPVAIVSTAVPQATNTTPPQHTMGSRKHYVGLPNFGEVTPNLFRGGQPGVDGLEALEKMGVSIVVDMRGSKSLHEETVVSQLGMQYVAIPWHCPFPSDPVFARFLKLVQDNPGKKIFVHCRLGDDRTGMAIAAYRMAEEGWSANEALAEMKMFGFTAAHHAICPTLALYEKRFPEHLKTNPIFKDIEPPAAGGQK
jgi:tyrosine-protein phosphatase SIW14